MQVSYLISAKKNKHYSVPFYEEHTDLKLHTQIINKTSDSIYH